MLVKMETGSSGGGGGVYLLYYYSSGNYVLSILNSSSDVYCHTGTTTSNTDYEDDYVNIYCGSSIHEQYIVFKKAGTILHDNTGDVSVPFTANTTYWNTSSGDTYRTLPLVVKFD